MDQAKLEQLSDLLGDYIANTVAENPTYFTAKALKYEIDDCLEAIEDAEFDGMSINPEIEAERLRD